MSASKERKESTRQLFESNSLYTASNICRTEAQTPKEYVDRLLSVKLETVRRYLRDGLLVDLCCAIGEHIWSIKPSQGLALGIDFSTTFLDEAEKRRKERSAKDVAFIAADARSLPLLSGSVATLYSLSSLYVIPNLDGVIAEIARVLGPGGRCVLDLGNSLSLNSFCVRRYYRELPTSYHVTVAHMKRLCANNALRVVEHRSFQILPLWAGRPRWMWPLLHPMWKTLLGRRIAGRMLDEWLSSFPLLRPFAFRHLLVCEKC